MSPINFQSEVKLVTSELNDNLFIFCAMLRLAYHSNIDNFDESVYNEPNCVDNDHTVIKPFKQESVKNVSENKVDPIKSTTDSKIPVSPKMIIEDQK